MLRRASVTTVPQPTLPSSGISVAHFNSLCDLIKAQTQAIIQVRNLLEEQRLRPPVDLDIFVSTQPTALSRNERRCNRLWVASGQSCLVNNLHGGFTAITLQAGWNPMDLVEGAQILVQSGPGFNALWQCLDTVTSGALL